MSRNTFLKINLDSGKESYINVDNITHIKNKDNYAVIYIIGKGEGLETKELFERVIMMLPSTINYDEIVG